MKCTNWQPLQFRPGRQRCPFCKLRRPACSIEVHQCDRCSLKFIPDEMHEFYGQLNDNDFILSIYFKFNLSTLEIRDINQPLDPYCCPVKLDFALTNVNPKNVKQKVQTLLTFQ